MRLSFFFRAFSSSLLSTFNCRLLISFSPSLFHRFPQFFRMAPLPQALSLSQPEGCAQTRRTLKKSGQSVALLLGVLHVVLLELAVQGGLANAKHARGGELVAAGFAQSAKNRAALQFLEGQDFIFFRDAFRGGIVQVGWQIRDVENRSGTQRSEERRVGKEWRSGGWA